ncbi:MAG: hypothetical protein ACRYFX_06350 [Janthinobacterium lividum]
MKKLISVLLCTAPAASYAQTAIKAGAIQLGGNISYSQSNSASTAPSSSIGGTSNTESHSFSVAPSGGYFVADNLAVGLSVGYSSSYQYAAGPYASSPYSMRTKGFNVGPFVQYYRLLTNQFGLTGTVNASYGYSTSNYVYVYTSGIDNTDKNSKGYYANVVPGLVFFPVPKLALGAAAGGFFYNHLHSTTLDNLTSTTLTDGNSSSFSANFGLSYLTFSGTYYLHR